MDLYDSNIANTNNNIKEPAPPQYIFLGNKENKTQDKTQNTTNKRHRLIKTPLREKAPSLTDPNNSPPPPPANVYICIYTHSLGN